MTEPRVVFRGLTQNLSILSIDQTGEMVYTNGMKYFGNMAAEADSIQLSLMVSEVSSRLARRASVE